MEAKKDSVILKMVYMFIYYRSILIVVSYSVYTGNGIFKFTCNTSFSSLYILYILCTL